MSINKTSRGDQQETFQWRMADRGQRKQKVRSGKLFFRAAELQTEAVRIQSKSGDNRSRMRPGNENMAPMRMAAFFSSPVLSPFFTETVFRKVSLSRLPLCLLKNRPLGFGAGMESGVSSGNRRGNFFGESTVIFQQERLSFALQMGRTLLADS